MRGEPPARSAATNVSVPVPLASRPSPVGLMAGRPPAARSSHVRDRLSSGKRAAHPPPPPRDTRAVRRDRRALEGDRQAGRGGTRTRQRRVGIAGHRIEPVDLLQPVTGRAFDLLRTASGRPADPEPRLRFVLRLPDRRAGPRPP